MRLTELAWTCLEKLSERRGVSQADIVEQLIRDAAQRLKIWDGKSTHL